jgi:hypothetical protein
MWRTEYDISLEKNHVEWWRLVANYESNTAHAVFSAPESWNDADMLEIGNPGLSDTEAQAQFSMWAMSPSPLLAGADLVNMNARSRQIYTNREVIAIDQDSLGAGAELVSSDIPGVEVWQRPLGSRTGGDVAVMLLNATDTAVPMHVAWTELGLEPEAKARDVWAHQNLPVEIGFSKSIAPHSAVLLRVHGKRAWTHGIVFEAETPSNLRSGNAQLMTCGECSKGYALTLGGDDVDGGVRFSNISVNAPGVYQMRILYVRNGLEDKTLGVTVNDSIPINVHAIMRSWNAATIPVTFRSGVNSVEIHYKGKLGFDLDNVEFYKRGSKE